MSKPGFYKEDGTKISLRDLAKLPADTNILIHEHPCRQSAYRNMLKWAKQNHGDLRLGRNKSGLFKGRLVVSEIIRADQHQGHENDPSWNGRSGLRHKIIFTGVEPFKPIDGRGAPTGRRPAHPQTKFDFLLKKSK